MNYEKKGFTLIEMLIALTIGGTVTAGVIKNEMNQNEKMRQLIFIEEAYSIIQAVDSRIAIDGYNSSSWKKQEWNNEKDIVDNLIKKELTSSFLSNCQNGMWNPSIVSEEKTKLIECDTWKERKNNGEDIKARIKTDSTGYIQNFELIISFNDDKAFSNSFLELKNGLVNVKKTKSKELSGIHTFNLISQSSDSEITNSTCINDYTDCAIKLTLDRSGGNEYIRADGENSLINDHFTFMETKDDLAPLKCIRWVNSESDGSGTWSKEPIEECGVGIYKTSLNSLNVKASVVDVVVDNGTFKNVTLDQNCTVYKKNSIGEIKADTSIYSPCGLITSGSEIYQVVDNTMSTRAYIKEANIEIANVKSLISNVINTDYLNVISDLDVTGLSTFNGNATFNGEATFNGISTFNDDVSIKSAATLTVDNGITAGYVHANFVSSAPIGDFTNINNSLSAINNNMSTLQSSSNEFEAIKKDVQELVKDKRARDKIKKDTYDCEHKANTYLYNSRSNCSYPYSGRIYTYYYKDWYYYTPTNTCKSKQVTTKSGGCSKSCGGSKC